MTAQTLTRPTRFLCDDEPVVLHFGIVPDPADPFPLTLVRPDGRTFTTGTHRTEDEPLALNPCTVEPGRGTDTALWLDRGSWRQWGEADTHTSFHVTVDCADGLPSQRTVDALRVQLEAMVSGGRLLDYAVVSLPEVSEVVGAFDFDPAHADDEHDTMTRFRGLPVV